MTPTQLLQERELLTHAGRVRRSEAPTTTASGLLVGRTRPEDTAALVSAARRAPGWTEERLTRLATYRNGPSPLVAGTTRFMFPPDTGEAS